MSTFLRVGISSPIEIRDEATRIEALLRSGAIERFHIRKPGYSDDELRSFLESLPQRVRSQSVLHGSTMLAAAYGLYGSHPDQVSKSVHSLAELSDVPPSYEYVFLSPIFNSISKPGYQKNFNQEQLQNALSRTLTTVVALGGVREENFDYLASLGFKGAAMCGAIWRKTCDIQFLTDPYSNIDFIDQIESLLRGGARWVQLRMKELPYSERLETAAAAKRMCDPSGAVLIINDDVEIAKRIRTHGVHLGREDTTIAYAREKLGPKAIIGATANCAQDIRIAVAEGANYIGLGPLRMTATKKALAPILGNEGVAQVIQTVRAEGINIPIVVIGGVLISDLSFLMRSGANGVAVTSAVFSSPQPDFAVREFQSKWEQPTYG